MGQSRRFPRSNIRRLTPRTGHLNCPENGHEWDSSICQPNEFALANLPLRCTVSIIFQSRLWQILSSNSLSCSRSIVSPDLQSTATQHRCVRGSAAISTLRIYVPHHVTKRKSSGTSPNVFKITASSNSPNSAIPCRENATAPAFASFLASASALRTAAAA